MASWKPLLALLLFLGMLLRLIDAQDAPLDFHPTRQLRNYVVAREIYYHLIPSSTEVREQTRALRAAVGLYEPPIMETLVALTYPLFGGENFAVPRLWGALLWALSGWALFDLTRRAFSPWAALLGLAYYLVLPFGVQASRSFQPDPLMTALFASGLWALYRWSESQGETLAKVSWRWAVLAGLLLGLTALVKVVIAPMAGGAALAIVWATRRRFWSSSQVWVMAAFMLLPAFTYYILLHPGRSSEYLVSWSLALLKLVTSSDFYSRWLAFLGSLFGLTALFAALAGIFLAPMRLSLMLLGAWLGYLVYGLTLPFQMYTHSYYHLQLLPLLMVGLAGVLHPLLGALAARSRWQRVAFGLVVLALLGYQAWVARSVLVAEDFRHEPKVWVRIGEAIPPHSKVIALTQDYGYRLLYFGWRRVDLWPFGGELATLRGVSDPASRFDSLTEGKDYFLVTSFKELERQPELRKRLEGYAVAAQGDGFVLYDLHRPLTP